VEKSGNLLGYFCFFIPFALLMEYLKRWIKVLCYGLGVEKLLDVINNLLIKITLLIFFQQTYQQKY
jgi:mannose/fructose/N-acetylgalactosamine-specific phosphotransferase system component IID